MFCSLSLFFSFFFDFFVWQEWSRNERGHHNWSTLRFFQLGIRFFWRLFDFDCQNEPEIDSYIQNIGKHSKGNCEEDDLPTASSAFDHSENEDDAKDDVSDEEESFDTQLIRRNFSEAFEEYRNKILEYQSSNPQDPSINRAMIAMTKTLRRSMKCLPATIQNQMHNFGKGTIAKNRSKNQS